MLNRVREWLFDSPIAQTVMFALSSVLAGVFASAFVTEIADQPLHWERFARTISFWILLGLLLLISLYSRGLYVRQRDIMKWADQEYCKAYMNSQCLPEVARRQKEAIRMGQLGVVEEAYVEMMKFKK